MKQRSILREVTAKGKAVHTGEEVSLTIKPAPVDHGVVFRRVDLWKTGSESLHWQRFGGGSEYDGLGRLYQD